MVGYSQAGNNISGQFGMPLYGIQGTLPPFTGNYFWVNETTGSDGNTGGPQDPFKTLTQAHSACLAGNNDVVYLTGTVHTTATTVWSKNNTHLIGLDPMLDSEARARISQTGTTVFTPLVSVTAAECIFSGIGSFHGFVDLTNQICWADSGQRNQYFHCAFLGMGNATGGASQTGSRSLTVGGGGNGENTFTNCIIGLDTIQRSAANASLEFLGGSPRNVFRKCIFPIDSSSNASLIVTCGASGMDRWALFEDCSFINCVDSGSVNPITNAFTMNASAGGSTIIQGGSALGFTNVSASGPVYVNMPASAATGVKVTAAT